MSGEMAGLRLALSWLVLQDHFVLPPADLLQDATSLSQLPLDQLLQAKRALSSDGAQYEQQQKTEVAEGALPLHGDPGPLKKKLKDRDGWEGEEELADWKGASKGKGDIQSIFQITVTVLAFLAFGGYLLCLIIRAVRGSAAINLPNTALPQNLVMMSPPVMMTPPVVMTPPVRFKRGLARPSAEDMHSALVALAEGYAKYSQSIK